MAHVEELGIFLVLFALTWFSLHAVVERSLYHLGRRAADPTVLEHWLRRCRRHGTATLWTTDRDLHWLAGLLARARGDVDVLTWLCHSELALSLRSRNFLRMMMGLAGLLGLLGTVAALSHAAATADRYAVLSVGLTATKWGLLLAAFVTPFSELLGARAARIADQIDSVLAVLEVVRAHKETAVTTKLNRNAREGANHARKTGKRSVHPAVVDCPVHRRADGAVNGDDAAGPGLRPAT